MIKHIHIHKKWKSIFLISIIVLFSSNIAVFAQVRKEFTQRTSSHALQQYVKPGSQGKIYNLRGDFAMAGNTNITFTNYSDNASNSSNLSYVDIDFDGSTINSSSSYLNLLDDGCTEIVYAGLYWSGRANTGNMSFNATGTVQGNPVKSTATQTLNHTHNGTNNLDETTVVININNTNPNDVYSTQLVRIGNKQFEFTIRNNSTVFVRERTGNGSWSASVQRAVTVTNNTTINTPIITNGNYNYGTPTDGQKTSWSGGGFGNLTRTRTFIQTASFTRSITKVTTTTGYKTFTLNIPITYVNNGQTYTISQLRTYFKSVETKNYTEVGTATRTVTEKQDRPLLSSNIDSSYGSSYYSYGNYSYSNITNNENSVSGTYVYNATLSDFRNPSNNFVTIQGPKTTTTTSNVSYNGTLSKNKIKLKKGNGAYQIFTASADDISYPNGTDANMYAAYVDVTEYVRTHGAGNYFVADIATTQGESDNTGYFGGWGLVVVYANPNMKWRDITIFDGYAYVAGGIASHQLPIAGFQAAQSGLVNVDIGIMAGEGDRSISGDYFQVLARGGTSTNDEHYKNLGNSGETGGFFNSNISTGSIKSPNLLNNTGIDIQRISLPNQTKVYNSQSGDKNFIIGNNQTSTTFKYGSTQDTYIIYNLVFAVDAYIPDVEGVNQVVTTSTSADIENLQPGDEVTYTLDIYNYGSDAIQNGKIDITIPQGLHLDSYSMVQNNTGEEFIETGATASFNFSPPEWINPTMDNTATPDLIDGGLLRWQLGDIPTQALVPNFEERVPLATLTYTLKVTDNCLILMTSEEDCALRPQINGEITGIGVNSGHPFSGTFIKAYDSDCNNTPIYGSIEMEISPSTEFLQNCSLDLPIVDETRIFRKFCSVNNNVIPRDEVTNVYPEGTVFYSNLPTSASPIVVNGDFYVNPNGTQTMYYAVLPNGNLACFYKLATILDVVTSTPTIGNYQFCQGEEIVVSATPGTVGLDVFYFNSNTSGATPVDVPNSLPVGTHTYWVADGSNVNGDVCYGEKVAFTITIHLIPNEVLTNDIEICAGTSYTTSLNTPSGISALWQYQTTNSSTWVDLNNQLSGVSVESNELAIQNAQVELNQIKFRVIHTNSNGCTNTTDEFTLTVKACHMMINPMLSDPFKKP